MYKNKASIPCPFIFGSEPNLARRGNHQHEGLRSFSLLEGAISVFAGRPVGSFLHQLLPWSFNTPSSSLLSPNNLILLRLPMILGLTHLQLEVKIAFQLEAAVQQGIKVERLFFLVLSDG